MLLHRIIMLSISKADLGWDPAFRVSLSLTKLTQTQCGWGLCVELPSKCLPIHITEAECLQWCLHGPEKCCRPYQYLTNDPTACDLLPMKGQIRVWMFLSHLHLPNPKPSHQHREPLKLLLRYQRFYFITDDQTISAASTARISRWSSRLVPHPYFSWICLGTSAHSMPASCFNNRDLGSPTHVAVHAIIGSFQLSRRRGKKLLRENRAVQGDARSIWIQLKLYYTTTLWNLEAA